MTEISRLIYKAIQSFKDFVNRSKNMEKKIDIILDKLENKEDN
ncbi:carboxymuconolactone decarboxylase [Clostridium estertheticum]|nr:carboxymuconolactone decarboxylase [Clostridium estertheticum]MBU3073935.1 carboxymuconolactone decarboxylase [Clostridium estertheticum]MBU3187152.1 carboxymuconolactone decarboxylase [Clostridium estertheticum]